MGLFSKTKNNDKLIKYFNDKKISYELVNNKYTFELIIKDNNYSLFPYFRIDEENNELSIIINIKKATKDNLELYKSINEFNLVSKYFSMKLSSDDVIYIEANIIFSDIVDDFNKLIKNIYELSDVILKV